MRNWAFGGAGSQHRLGQAKWQHQIDTEALEESTVVDVAEPISEPESVDTTPEVTVTATYDDAAIATLLFMLEEEKLAGDIYEAFYDMYGLKIFDNIAQSEDNHFDALLAQAEALGLDVDEFVFEDAGTFVDPELQDMYDTLLAEGSLSLTDALEVGVLIEETDIIDISDAIEGVEGTVLADVYQNLLDGSLNHLDAFESVLA